MKLTKLYIAVTEVYIGVRISSNILRVSGKFYSTHNDEGQHENKQNLI